MSSFCERRDASRWGIYCASYDFFSIIDICKLAPTEICSHYALRDFIQAERRELTEQQENLYFWWLQFEPQHRQDGRYLEHAYAPNSNPAYALGIYIFHLPFIVNENEQNVEIARLHSIFSDVYDYIVWSEMEEDAYWLDAD